MSKSVGEGPSSARWAWACLLLCASAPLGGCQSRSVERLPPQALSANATPTELELATVELSNPSNFGRSSSPVYFSNYDLGIGEGELPGKHFELRAAPASIPLQLVDQDGNGAKDGVFGLVDFAPQETKTFRIVALDGSRPAELPQRAQAELAVKQGGQWQPREKDPKRKEYVGGAFTNVEKFTPPPEHTDHSNLIRYEGPGIESDRVGYRIYLDERNGFDIFGKKTREPVLQKVGLDGYESYHQPAAWGMDILKVGASLGTGAFGFWNGKGVELVSQVEGWDAAITEHGGLYASFRINYKGWNVGGKKSNLSADFSMRGGSRLVHTRLHSDTPLPTLAIGVVKHPDTELLVGSTDVTEMAYSYVASWGQQSLDGGLLGMAVLFRRGALQSQETTSSDYVAVVTPRGQDFDYHFLAAWAGEPGGVATRAEFVAYLEQQSEELTLALRERLRTTRSQQAQVFPSNAESALGWAQKLADSELARKTLLYRHDGWDTNRGRKPKFEYDISGLLPLAYAELQQVAPDPRYADVSRQLTGSFVSERGQIETYEESAYSLDSVMPGEVLLRLYEQTQDERYKTAAGQLRRQLERHPRTKEGAFWHKQRYPSQLWLDGVYMGMPFLAHYSRAFEAGRSLDEVIKEFELTRQHLRDPATGLYWHAWDEAKRQSWADPATGLSKIYWGRGLGWFSMAVVDVLDHIPEDDAKHREPLLAIVRELAPALLTVQDKATHTWWQVLDRPTAPGNYRESSASAMFAYFLAKSVRKGYLPDAYRARAVEAFDGLVAEFVRVHPDGRISLTNQCLVAGLGAGRDGSYRYYMSEPVWQNDPKATGPFILAAVELHRLLRAPSPAFRAKG
ncbi:MAG TPA: glycoside hydrolase family 88 protein [Polyangiaceae bacterium]|nr:glycoside hydrolase family 88 protein [Polyangiaceae bacterium]